MCLTAQSTVDNQLRKHTNSAGNTKENSVVARLGQAVVLQKDTGVLRGLVDENGSNG